MLKSSLLLAATLAIGSAYAQTPTKPANTAASASVAPAAQHFTQAPLPYASNALEPVIDTATMELHYGKHHKSYYDNLNKEVASNSKLGSHTLPQLIQSISKYPDVVRNNAGGAWNHDFFWATMAPDGQRGEPSAALLKRIEADFGSLDKLKTEFNTAGGKQFGSGWTWLIVQKGKLVVSTTPNQDNPLMDVVKVKGTPILGNDVWEHAYYLKYNNRRADYLKEWWQVVNWNEVNKRFDEAMKK